METTFLKNLDSLLASDLKMIELKESLDNLASDLSRVLGTADRIIALVHEMRELEESIHQLEEKVK